MSQSETDELVAVDFETYYDADYSLTTMSTWNYIHDARFDAYLVAIFGNGIKFTGHPSKLDWHILDGKTVVMHNASFDEMVFERLKETGVVPADVTPKQVLCTADLVAYLGCKRDLKTATKELLGEEADKTVRANMKGKHYADAVAAGMEDELLQYGCDDAIHCFKLAEKYLSQWPENERTLSTLNRKAGATGVYMDTELVDKGLAILREKLRNVEEAIPWIEEGLQPLSAHAIRAQGRKDGIPVPASLAKDDLKVIEWQNKYGNEFPWVKATGEFRSVNTLLKRVESLKTGIRADGTMPYQCKYYGASTGRMSGGGDGGGKFNMQNMPQHDMFGVDVRPMFHARPGKTYVISDFSQIEARILLWRVRDEEFISLVKSEGNLYIAFARKAQNKLIKKGTPEYKLAKCQVLQLGYYCGPQRFMDTANKPPYNLGLTLEEATAAVYQYRDANPKIVDHWNQHQKWLQFSVNHNDPSHDIELPSGRILSYYNPRSELVFDEKRGKEVLEYTAFTERGGHRTRIHSGILTNNEIQGTARDVLRDSWIALDKAGYSVLWSVHDEVIVEVDKDKAKDAAVEIVEIMRSSSPWAAGCPLDAEAVISEYYCK